MSHETVTKLIAFKPNNELMNTMVYCEPDDSEATRFRIQYPNSFSAGLDFDSKSQAEEVQNAMEKVCELGVEQGKSQIRSALGCKS